ncbi:MAG: 16S rRNA (cytosine(1402)-N(4))-methyltransferase RsmH [Bacteroidia bacterium]|nr:16S rRNA (cytosine(1402)-N(4))-methyltransferase RsmH [Bacteroidia bacterium]
MEVRMTNYHTPVMLDECINGLNIDPDGTYVDVTYGGGGHSKVILDQLSDKGVLLVFDQDGGALNNKIDDPRLIFCEANFEYLANFCSYYKLNEIDGLLADLGVSSHHLNDKDRGFSFRFEESELDMRMNSSSEISALDILNIYDQPSLAKVFRSYGELDKASPLANAVVSYRNIQPIKTNGDLIAAVSKFTNERSKNKMLAKIYQALRIEVNREISTLKSLLNQATDLLKPQGRLVVMSYHSLEDRIVKNLIQTGNVEGKLESDTFGRVDKRYRPINKKPIEASKEEVDRNSRARSAKLRVAEKI